MKKIEPRILSGIVTPPPSKSECIRAITAVSLHGGGIVNNYNLCDDITAAIRAVRGLGCETECNENLVIGQAPPSSFGLIDCGESAAVMRFFIPICIALGGSHTILRRGSLLNRRFDLYGDMNSLVTAHGDLLVCQGSLEKGEYTIDASHSSQAASGMLFALSAISGESRLTVNNAVSEPYIDMTVSVLRKFGVKIIKKDDTYEIHGGRRQENKSYTVSADYSQAAVFYAINYIQSLSGDAEITVSGLSGEKSQPDTAFTSYLNLLKNGQREIDVRNTPDVVPLLAVCAALTPNKETVLCGTERLKYKESDRIKGILGLNNIGAGISFDGDCLNITGVNRFSGGTVNAQNDHRLVMCFAAAATGCDSTLYIEESNGTEKSYPNFFIEYNKLGGDAQ